jgi:hypothetical protein
VGELERKAPRPKGISGVVAYCRDGVPYNDHRQRLIESHCEVCSKAFLHPKSNRNRFCSNECRAKQVIATGQFKGEKNPRWLGGVSNDNMRYRRRQMERDPEKEAARRAVLYAVRTGKLVRQPCEKCGETPAEGHHDDYSKPLEVRWLCPTHHDAHHAEERRLDRIKRIEANRP